MHYRKEIDGLRAIAVLAVMLFHAGFNWIAGGFLGVDIFFVISGYLITSLIFIEISNNRFSIIDFYERRARRLLPALFLVMLACIPFATLTMQPDDLQNFGQSLISSSLMANNILLYLTSGYWDIASEFKPLLHTWSLGVEEQYYIFFPLLVLLIWRLSPSRILTIFLILTIISFIFSSWIQTIDKDADFYLLPSRIWELGIGASAALFLFINKGYQASLRTRLKDGISIIGTVLIIAPIIFFNHDPELLNVHRLSVVMGTGMLIFFADGKTILGNLLGLRQFVFVGLMSYSLYLWHQPLYAFLRISSLNEPSNLAYIVMLAFAFVLAYFSLQIENIFREKDRVSSKKFTTVIILSLTICISSGLIFTQTYGFYRHYPELESNYSSITHPTITNPDTHFLISANQNLEKKFSSTSSSNKLIVMGDSFSSDFINMGKVNGFFQNWSLVKPKYNCFNYSDIDNDAEDLILESDLIIITYRLLEENLQRECLERKIQFITNNQKSFILIGPKDFGYNINAPLRQKIYSHKAKPNHDIEIFNSYLEGLVNKNNFIDLIALIGSEDRKIPLFTKSNKLISYDRAHLTFHGAKDIGELLFQHPRLKKLR